MIMSLTNIERIQADDRFNELDALLITKPENVLYCLGFKIESDTLILIPNMDRKDTIEKTVVFLNALEYDQAEMNIKNNKALSSKVEIREIPTGKVKFVEKTINKMNLHRVGFEDESIPVKKHEEWKSKFEIAQFIGASVIISKARLTKTTNEIESIKKACKIGDIGFKTIYDSIEEGMTEVELAAEAEYAMRKAGAEGTSFPTIVATGERSAFPHAKTSDEKKVKNGDIILVDIGARYDGYCSDLTRTFIFGKKNQDKAKLINLVNEVQEATINKIETGMKCIDADKIARDLFIQKSKEWGSRFIHSLGHGVGIDIHENPYLSPISEESIEENMVFTIEPGLYIPGLGGARTEDLVVIQKSGIKVLTHAEKFYY